MPPRMSSQEDSTVDGRDERIARLEKLLEEQFEAHMTALAELSAVKVQSAEDARRASLELQELRNENEILHRRLAQLANDTDKRALHEYATLIVEAAPSTVNSAYVVQLQSKLCKAIHQRGVWENQLTMLKESCQKVVKSLQDDVVDAVNEKCQAEMDALNKVQEAEKEKNLIRAECEDKVSSIEEKLNSQREEIERLRIHLEMEKETRESLVSVYTQQRAEESVSLGEKKKKMSRENSLTQEDIERTNDEEAEKEKNLIRAECEDKVNSVRLEYEVKLKSQQEEIERLRFHSEMQKGMRESLVSVYTQERAEESASLGEEKERMSRENSLTQEDIERTNEVVDQLRLVSDEKSMQFSGNAVEVNDQIPKSGVPSNRIGQKLSQLGSSLTFRNRFLEQLTMDLGKEIGPPRGTGNSTQPSPDDQSEILFSSRMPLTSILGIADQKELGAKTA